MNIQGLPDVQLHFSHLKEQEILERIETVRELRAAQVRAEESKGATHGAGPLLPKLVPLILVAAFALIAILALVPHPL